jgi:hypothetical protein
MLAQYVETISSLLKGVYEDPNRSESLMRSTMGVIGDLSECFPNGEYAELFRQEFLLNMVKEVRSNREYSGATIQTARWARDQLRAQTGQLPISLLSTNHNIDGYHAMDFNMYSNTTPFYGSRLDLGLRAY